MFPSEIVSDILSRLPVKPLLRFRCVSKQWCTLIGSQEFIKLHLNRSIKTSSNINIMLGYLGVYSINVDSLDVAQRLNPPLSCSEFSNSCNGLVLVLSKNPCIWNPATRKFKELTACPVEYPPGENVSSAFETYGFAYDSETDDYLVARVVEFKKRYDFSWIRSETRVFSLNSNSWKKMPDFPYQLPYKRVWGAHLNGVLHTAIEKVSLGSSTIMAYDTRNGSHYVVPKPKFGVRDAADFTVEVLRGCLCLLLPLRQHRMDIWVMKEYGKKESWTKLLTVAPPLVEPYVTLVPLVYSRDGTKVLLNHDDKAFIWYDLRNKKVTKVSLNGLPHMFYTEVYTESLVSVDGFGDKDGLKKQNNGGEDGLKKQCKGKTFKGKRDDFLSKGFKLAL